MTLTIAALAVALSAGNDFELSITKIAETRIAEVTQAKKSEFSFMDDKPVLKVSMAISLPEGSVLVNISEPSSIEAKDDTGKDLTNIDKNFSGDKQFWMVSFGDEMDQGKVTLQLVPTAREAKTMSLSLKAQASVATGTEDVELERSKNWKALDKAIFGESAEFRMSRASGNVYFEIKPEEARERIEEVLFLGDGEPIESDSVMWGNGYATYGFPDGIKDDMKMVVKARTGFESREVTIEAEGVKLP